LPPPLADVKKLPDLLTSIGLKANIASETGVSLALKATDEAAAEEIEGIVNRLLDTAKQALAAQMAALGGDNPGLQVMKQINDNVLQPLKPDRKARTVTLALRGNSNAASIGTTVALVLPAVQAGREAARRITSMNNMKMISLAMHNYHTKEKVFPPAYKADASGKALLSWRVLILPYLGEDALYKKFHLDEPWDSEHNKALIAKMPSVYRNPNSKVAGDGKTNYLTVRGERTVFPGDKGVRAADIKDGTSNTIITVEVPDGSAVEWTKPDDFAYDETNPLKGLVGLRPMVFLAGLADGSVRAFPATIDPATLKLLFMRDDRTPIDFSKF
jgi:hypothetical protein